MEEENRINLQPQIPDQGLQTNDGLLVFPDGSAVLPHSQQEFPSLEKKISLNLAEILDPFELNRIGISLKQSIEEDSDSQKEYFESVSNIIDLLGIQAIKSAQSGLASGQQYQKNHISSSALFETLQYFTATIMASIFPTKAPVSCQILGESNEELDAAAYRKSAFFNSYLQNEDKGFDKELNRTVLWSVLTGSIYAKVYIDSVLGKPTMRMIQPDNFIVNRDLSSHLSAIRKTQKHTMSTKEFLLRKRNGEFIDIDIKPQDVFDDSPIKTALSEISGVNAQSSNMDESNKQYVLYECHVETLISIDSKGTHKKIPSPYIVTLDAETGRILRIVRNWDENDKKRKKKESFVNFSFLPSFEGEGYGLLQIAGNNSQLATEILRVLIQAGSYASIPAGFISSTLKKDKSITSPQPGTFIDLQTGNVPISQAISPLPFKEPSQVLFDLKNQIEDNIRKQSAIVNNQVAEVAPNAPMGTTLAILESLHRIPNFVLQKYHKSFAEVLKIYNECFYEWLPDNEPYPFNVPGVKGTLIKNDFQPNLQIVPASDPTMQSSAYRLMRAELILNNALKAPQVHNLREVEKLFYKNLNVSEEEINKLLVPDNKNQQPPSLDPVSENMRLSKGEPVKAFLPQDHNAHITVHKSLLANQDIAQNGALAGAIQAHIYEHICLGQQLMLSQNAGIEIPQDPASVPVEVQNQIAEAAAQVLQQQQQEQQQQPDPQAIVAQAQMIAAQAEQQMVQVRAQEAELNAQVKQMQMQLEERKLALEEMKFQQEGKMKSQKLALDENVASAKHDREEALTTLDLEKGKLDLLQRSQAMAIE